MDFRPILFIVGLLLSVLAVSMLIPAIVDLIFNNPDWQVFLVCTGVTLFFGIQLVVTNRQPKFDLSLKQAFVLTTLSWVFMTIFASIPFYFSILNLSFTDAMFEAMSGLTTTGATVIVGLDTAPPGILMWRALLQGLGGVGIIVMAMSVLPFLRVGGMQLFRLESSDRSEKLFPRAKQMASAIGMTYIMLFSLCAFFYWLFGMNGFDAIAHAFTTISTGGFSTKDGSFGFFNSAALEFIAIVFMILGSLPFILYIRFVVDGDFKGIWRNRQVIAFLKIAAVAVLILILWQIIVNEMPWITAIRESCFSLVSIITTTGYATADYSAWGGLPQILFLFIMFIGGCSGATSGGIKVFRFQILAETIRYQVIHAFAPRRVIIMYENRKPLPPSVPLSVVVFISLFALCFAIVALFMSMTGLDFITSLSAAVSCLSNIGPGLGPMIGPKGNYIGFSDLATWGYTFMMLVGRLEIYTVLILLLPAFWRK